MWKRILWTTLASAAALAALGIAGLLVHRNWDSILTAVFSPVGGFVVKLIFGGKVIKWIAIGVFAVVAAVVAVRKRLSGDDDMADELTQPQFAPPVYGPPLGGETGAVVGSGDRERALPPPRGGGQFDAVDPLDPPEAAPAGGDQPERTTVAAGQRAATHSGGQ
jgi:hypothetical protein